jgi:hypothetical protein
MRTGYENIWRASTSTENDRCKVAVNASKARWRQAGLVDAHATYSTIPIKETFAIVLLKEW